MGKRELTDVTVEIVHETERAWLVDDGTRKVWLPKSRVQNNDDGTFTLPISLAQEKELI